ncbi:FxsA family protein [Rubrivirga sp. IMCC45206]|uniref:FxsA family protein n=1 Tax=Rubrivirga sp. IMCC45206 TaxID=3391614 RepID=UPI0039903722
MFGRLFLLFLVVPLVDLALLVHVGGRIGFWPTVAIVVLTAMLGSWLARREGVAAWQRLQTKLATGGLPGPEVVDGAVILIAGTLLLTPGFLTDIAGLLGLFPPTRALARRALQSRFKKAVAGGSIRVASAPFGVPMGPSPFARPPVVEDAEVIDDGSGEPG